MRLDSAIEWSDWLGFVVMLAIFAAVIWWGLVQKVRDEDKERLETELARKSARDLLR